MTTKKTHFNIDARILFQLGEQLVTDRAVALAELIKNSYDADASIVKISMRNIISSGGNILIVDNGEGINAKAFEDKWMRIATIDKEENPISKKYGRKKAGEKGIGRFACRRISKKMLLKSVAINEKGKKEQLTATFDWDKFKPGDDLIEIPINFSVEPTDSNTKTGTSIYLDNINDSWSRNDIRKLRLELLDLFTPDTLIRSKQKLDFEDDPGFNVEFDIPDFPDKTEALDRSFFNNAWAVITGDVGESGNASFNINYLDPFKGGKVKKEFHKDDKYNHIKNIEFKCYVLIYRKEFFGSSEFGMGKASEIGRERGGIKVYSDNFRVFGYGRSGDDWLRVDYDRARSIEKLDQEAMELKDAEDQRPGLRLFQTRSLFGHVRFEKDENPMLEITVNRDSLIENEAFEELKHFSRLGIDVATVLYSNIVYKEREVKIEKEREEKERLEKEALAHKRRLEEEKRKAELEAQKAEEQRRIAEEKAKKAESDMHKAEEARRIAENELREAEEARRIAENERRKAELERNTKDLEEKKKREEELTRQEEEKRKVESEARRKELEARKEAEEQERKARDEREKQKTLEEESERKKKEIEEAERLKKEQELREKEKQLEEEKVLLRVLASTGTMMLMFQHELEGLTDDMKSIIINFRRLIAGKGDKSLENLINNYDDQIEMIKELGILMGSIIDRESRLEKKDWVILPIIKKIIKPFNNYINDVGAEITYDIPDYLRTPVIYRSEFISIIHNLITNSIKAIRTTEIKRIKINAYRNHNDLILQVLDTGKGLNKERWNEVFLPFTGYSEPDIRFGTGTGLGLKIVKDMILSYKGDIKFIDPPSGWNTCIEIKLPKN